MTTAQTEARTVESVRKWLDGGCSSWGLPSQQIEMLLSALGAKDAEIAALKKEAADIVRPFADEADAWWEKISSRLRPKILEPSSIPGEKAKFTVGHLRSARSFLDKLEGRDG